MSSLTLVGTLSITEIKEKVITAIRNLPDSVSFEDIYDVIFVQEKIAKALDDSKNNRHITQEQFEEKYMTRLSKK